MAEQEALCFVIRPFASAFKNVWDMAIRPAVIDAGLDPWDGQEERLGTNQIHKDISALIWRADLVIADITGPNPNVMYELGLAHAAKKRVVMLIDKNHFDKLPFDVSHIRCLVYDRDDLQDLRRKLIERIRSTRGMSETDFVDFFPDLKIVTPAFQKELAYLRSKLLSIKLIATPNCADIFFNDQLVGTGSANVHINTAAARNTVSVSTVGFYEYHSELDMASIEAGTVEITLDHVYDESTDIRERVTRRLPAWLRDRRRDPLNPALMRAVSSYLLMAGEREDALSEIEELLEVAPHWHLAQIQRGFYHGVVGELREAIPWYSRAAALCDTHYIAKYNLACNHALLGSLDTAIGYLEEIVSHEKCRDSIRAVNANLSRDPDFRPLWSDSRYRARYREIELELFPDAPPPEDSVRDGVQGYIF